MPRPSKLTPAVQDRIYRLIAGHRNDNGTITGGMSEDNACAAVGISPDSKRTWLRRGQRDHERGITTKYSKFYEALTQARSQQEAHLEERFFGVAIGGSKRVSVTTKEKIIEDPNSPGGDGVPPGYRRVKYKANETVEVSDDWRAMAEYLLRRFPDRWSRSEGRELTGADGQPIQVQSSQLPLDNLPPEVKLLILKCVDGDHPPEDLSRQIMEFVQDIDVVDVESRLIGDGGEGRYVRRVAPIPMNEEGDL